MNLFFILCWHHNVILRIFFFFLHSIWSETFPVPSGPDNWKWWKFTTSSIINWGWRCGEGERESAKSEDFTIVFRLDVGRRGNVFPKSDELGWDWPNFTFGRSAELFMKASFSNEALWNSIKRFRLVECLDPKFPFLWHWRCLSVHSYRNRKQFGKCFETSKHWLLVP